MMNMKQQSGLLNMKLIKNLKNQVDLRVIINERFKIKEKAEKSALI